LIVSASDLVGVSFAGYGGKCCSQFALNFDMETGLMTNVTDGESNAKKNIYQLLGLDYVIVFMI